MKKKLKLNLSGQAFKQMLANHAEKAIFGVIVIVVLLMMHSGFQSRNPFSGKVDYTPQALKAKASQAETKIKDNTWEPPDGTPGMKSVRQKDLKLDERLRDGMAQVPVAAYPTPTLIAPDLLQEQSLRIDPALLPPIDFELYAGTGPIALKSERGSAAARGKRLPAGLENRMVGYRANAGSAIAKGTSFVVISAKVPIREQTKLFQDAFLTSSGYDPERDRPKYVYFYVKRVEVLPNGSTSEPVQLNTTAIKEVVSKWADPPPEVVPSEYCDPAFTLPLQPLMLRPSEPWQKHSAFPTIDEKPKAAAGETPPAGETPDVPSADVPAADLPPQDVPTADAPAASEPSRRQPSAGHPGGRHPAEGAAQPERLVDFKLFRIYDYTVQPGHTYRYVVQLMLEDPNDPKEPTPKPDRALLDKAVIERLAGYPAGYKYRNYRLTEYSRPTEPITVPVSDKMLAGPVDLGRFAAFDRDGNGYFEAEPKGKVMVVAWDNALAADVAGQADVLRGSLLNFAADVEFLDPVSMMLQPDAGHTFKTDTLVVDIAGGKDLASRGRQENLGSGQMLLLDAKGNLVVVDEIDNSAERIAHQYDELAAAMNGGAATPAPAESSDRPQPAAGDSEPAPAGPHGAVEDEFFQ